MPCVFPRNSTFVVFLLLACCSGLLTTRANAQPSPLPQGTVAQPPPDAWQRNVVSDGFLAAQRRQRENDQKEKEHATQLSSALGGMLSGGNARFFGVSGDVRFRIRRDKDQFSQRIAANYASTAQPGKSAETTVENIQSRTRYDRFFSDEWVAFFGVQARHDRFQGLDLRLQVDPGFGYYVMNTASDRLWAEFGSEFLFDLRAVDATLVRGPDGEVVVDAMGSLIFLSRTSTLNCGRLFSGYTADLNELLSFAADAEYIQAITDATLFRFNAGASIATKVKGKWSIAATFAVAYENQPLPGKESLDTVSTLNIVYAAL